jgi:hypothetical protein
MMLHEQRVRLCMPMAWVLLPALAACGCGQSEATIRGRVTVQGKPLTTGTVLFLGSDNRVATGSIGPDGHYVANHASMGTLRVAVQSLRPAQVRAAMQRPKDAPPLPGRITNLVPVPQKYQSPETSELTCTVQQKEQEYNIDLP